VKTAVVMMMTYISSLYLVCPSGWGRCCTRPPGWRPTGWNEEKFTV